MSKIYPDTENVRRGSENYEKMPNVHRNNLEKNCNHIFVKAPTLTKDILEQMHSEIEPSTTYIFGHEVNTRQFWVLAGLMMIFLVSTTGTVIMWFTSTFDNVVFSNLVINNESATYEMWRKPSPKPLVKIYIFNYTNIYDFEVGNDEKLNVEEVGPYIYEESLERVNVNFENNYVSYQESRDYKFMPQLSIGRKQSDKLIVPNIPMFAAAAVNKNSNYFTRLAISGFLNSLNAKPFLNIAAHRLIMGYEDDLYTLSKSVLKLQNQRPYEQFGLLASKKGIQPDVYTINTGAKDINQIGKFKYVNDMDKLNCWSTNECNRFNQATDGSMHSPKAIRNKRPVQIYTKEMCRSLPLVFQKETTMFNGKIPAYRYSLPYTVFDIPDKNPENQCFCNLDSGECPPQGVFNATPCAFGAPAFLSFPHFYNGDPKLKDAITGLKSNPTKHETYADFHPTMGFVMAGKTRFQMNVQVLKSFGISQTDMFEDETILPIAWIEMSVEDKTLPEDMVHIIFQTTFTVKGIEVGLKYGCMLTSIVILIFLLTLLKRRCQQRNRSSSIRPLQPHENLS